ncbi:hypothetical protein [Paenibacillus wulumuqiensis]|uniref:hypothetical protein n=1 Tax=Paenibacillus wulumuqiensis TaxID=1567107 RepID=UPI0006195570|nr:hypothetical protein [Paenibacillus wulumuqiensis]
MNIKKCMLSVSISSALLLTATPIYAADNSSPNNYIELNPSDLQNSHSPIIVPSPINEGGVTTQDYRTYKFSENTFSQEFYAPGVITITLYPEKTEEIRLIVYRNVDGMHVATPFNRYVNVTAGQPQTIKVQVTGYTSVSLNSHYQVGKFDIMW